MAAVLKLRAREAERVTYAVQQIPIDRIRAFTFQPRKWFDPEEIEARADSMKLLGQQDPVTVEPVIDGDPDHDYELINGESRLRSARLAGLETLWAAVRSVPFGSKVEKHLASLVANFNRSDHTPMEISDALLVQTKEGGLCNAQIARALGKTNNWVGDYLSLQDLHTEFQALMHPTRPRAERLAPTTAFEIARLPMDEQEELLRRCRDVDGRLLMTRVKMRAAKKSGSEVLVPVVSEPWTLERHRRRHDHHQPSPESVARRRAGIEEFRRLLARSR